MGFKIEPKLSKKQNASQYASKEAKRCQNEADMEADISQMEPKWSQNGAKMEPKRSVFGMIFLHGFYMILKQFFN